MTSLTRLEFSGEALAADGAAHLAACSALRALDIASPQAAFFDTPLPGLEDLTVTFAPGCASSAASVANSVASSAAAGTAHGGGAGGALGGESAGLEAGLSLKDVERLAASFPGLQRLHLAGGCASGGGGGSGGAAALAPLARLPQLRRLCLERVPGLSRAAVAALAALPALRCLEVAPCSGAAAGLRNETEIDAAFVNSLQREAIAAGRHGLNISLLA